MKKVLLYLFCGVKGGGGEILTEKVYTGGGVFSRKKYIPGGEILDTFYSAVHTPRNGVKETFWKLKITISPNIIAQ